MKELIFEELKESMEKALQALEKSFSKVRTGRASLSCWMESVPSIMERRHP